MAYALAGEADAALDRLRGLIADKEDAEDFWQPTVERARELAGLLERGDGSRALRRKATARVRAARETLKLTDRFDPPW